MHERWSFPLRISSVNVTKSVVFSSWSHLLKKSLMVNFIFFVQWNELVVFVIWTSHFTFLNSHIISEFLLKVNSLTKLSSSEDSPLPSCRFDLSDLLIFTIFIYLFMLLTIAYQSSIIPKKLANRNYVVHNIWVRTIFKHKGPN